MPADEPSMPRIHLSGRFYNIAVPLLGLAYVAIVVLVLAVPARSDSPGTKIEQLARWEAIGSLTPLGLSFAPDGMSAPDCARDEAGWSCGFTGVKRTQSGDRCRLVIEVRSNRSFGRRQAICERPPSTPAS